MINYVMKIQTSLDKTKRFEFMAMLAIRCYLAPIFWMSGTEKLMHMQDTINWFGNADWGLGLPYPAVLAYLATFSELIGAICLALGLAVRWVAVPLMITMVVAMLTVHIENGWLVIADHQTEATRRLVGFLAWLKTEFPKRYQYITELGRPVILNNGIEFAATYIVMLLTLFFFGAGKYVSIDYWLQLWIQKRTVTVVSKV